MDTILTKDEQLVKEEVFTTNLLLSWLKTNFTLTNKRIICSTPNTLFGLIPMGKKEITQPLKNISSITSSTKLHLGRLVIGVLMIIFGLVFIKSFGFVLILLGVVLILNFYRYIEKLSEARYDDGGDYTFDLLSDLHEYQTSAYSTLTEIYRTQLQEKFNNTALIAEFSLLEEYITRQTQVCCTIRNVDFGKDV